MPLGYFAILSGSTPPTNDAVMVMMVPATPNICRHFVPSRPSSMRQHPGLGIKRCAAPAFNPAPALRGARSRRQKSGLAMVNCDVERRARRHRAGVRRRRAVDRTADCRRADRRRQQSVSARYGGVENAPEVSRYRLHGPAVTAASAAFERARRRGTKTTGHKDDGGARRRRRKTTSLRGLRGAGGRATGMTRPSFAHGLFTSLNAVVTWQRSHERPSEPR
jgi:hypothetical protein